MNLKARQEAALIRLAQALIDQERAQVLVAPQQNASGFGDTLDARRLRKKKARNQGDWNRFYTGAAWANGNHWEAHWLPQSSGRLSLQRAFFSIERTKHHP